MIQLIDKQGNNYRLLIDGKQYFFYKLSLWKDGIVPLKSGLNNGSLSWNIGKKKVSYWQIKKAINGN